MQAGAGAVFGRTTKYLAGLGAAIKENSRWAGRIEAYRTLETRLGKTRAAAREATESVAKPGAAMRATEQPSKGMQKEFGKARREAQRLTDSVTNQTRALGKQRAALRATERGRPRPRPARARARRHPRQATPAAGPADRLDGPTEGGPRAPGAMGGQLLGAVALGYPLIRTMRATDSSPLARGTP